MRRAFLGAIIVLVVSAALLDAGSRAAKADDLGITSAAYVISVDDELTISVLAHSDMTVDETVSPDGTINYPVVGTIRAAGMTIEELTKTIEGGLITINRPHVTVYIRQSRPRKVSVLGAVHASGQFDWKPGLRAVDAIAAAGGVQQEPEMTEVKLMASAGSKVSAYDLDYARMMKGDMTQNPELHPGDIVLVSERDPSQAQVQVIGEVVKPGLYTVPPDGASVVSLLAQVGGPTATAALTHAQIMHAGKTTDVDLRVLMQDLDDKQGEIRLYPGDVLMVPTNKAKIAVIGEVKEPGVYPIPDGETVSALSALANAGGLSADADRSKGEILRKAPDGQVSTIDVSVDKVLGGTSTSQTQLQAGDVFYVPTRVKHANSGPEGAAAVGIAGIIAGLLHF